MWQRAFIAICTMGIIGLGMTHPTQAQFDDLPIDAAWEAYKQRFIFCGDACGGDLGLVFDPSQGYQATSESSGYGLLMAVMAGDQTTFDVIYNATYRYLHEEESGLFDWRANPSGEVTGFGSATDADLDIAAALILAHRSVEQGTWQPNTERPYAEAANALIDNIYEREVVDGAYLKPGDLFGGEGRAIINISYFSPAWMQMFDAFQGTDRWQPVIDQSYASLNASPGAPMGLAPDWSTADGEPATEYCEAQSTPATGCGYEMRYESIRVPWRQAVHCVWNGDPRACDWSQRTVNFLYDLPRGTTQARFFDMSGKIVVSYQDTVMRSMWATAPLATGDHELARQFIDSIGWTPTNGDTPGYWGQRPEDYYHQSLAWFTASLATGRFRPIG